MTQQHIYCFDPGWKVVLILRKSTANYKGIQYLTSSGSGWLQHAFAFYTNFYSDLHRAVSVRDKSIPVCDQRSTSSAESMIQTPGLILDLCFLKYDLWHTCLQTGSSNKQFSVGVGWRNTAYCVSLLCIYSTLWHIKGLEKSCNMGAC